MRLKIASAIQPGELFKNAFAAEFPGATVASEATQSGFIVTYDWGTRPYSRPQIHSWIRGWRAAVRAMASLDNVSY